MVDIENIYTEVISKKLGYCELCLRSESEVHLLPAKNLRTFLEHLSPSLGFQFRSWKNACYICEAWAAKAQKLVQALFASISAHNIFYRKNYANAIYRNRPLSNLEIRKCNEQLAVTRKVVNLKQTEVLVVDNKEIALPGKDQQVESLNLLQPAPLVEAIETVVLDDEDCTSTSPFPNVDISSLKQFLIPVSNGELPNTTMYLTIPSGEVPWVIQDYRPDYRVLPQTTQTVMTDKPIELKIPEPFDDIRIESIRSMELKQTEISSNTNNFRYLNDPLKINSKRNCESDTTAVKKPRQEYTVDIDEVNKLIEEQSSLQEKSNENLGIVKEPLPNKDRIDWEDKIPMDIISYVDATDPNADPLLRNETQYTVQKPPSRSNATIDIIDLC